MTFEVWTLLFGVLLIAMVLMGTLLERLPLSAAMIYLGVGFGLGPAGWAILTPDPVVHAAIVERLAEAAVLISLFSVGLKLSLPLTHRDWWLPVRLAFGSMTATVGLVAVVAVLALDLPLGAAILLGAIMAPTDPVLASAVQVRSSADRDRLRFCLTGEGALNDGAAFPFVMLGLGLLGVHDLGAWGWRWLAMDVLWSTAGGLAIGAGVGASVGALVVYLRGRHGESVGLDELLAVGLIAVAYGLAVASHAYGFLSVFAAGLALGRVKERAAVSLMSAAAMPGETAAARAPRPDRTSAYMTRAVAGFNEQLERFGELAIVLAVGAMLTFAHWSADTAAFLVLLFLVIRPASVWLGLLRAPLSRDQRAMVAWFGIRGIGSVYYLTYAIDRGLPPAVVETLVSVTLAAVTASVVLHGISVRPMMYLYRKREGGNSRST